MRFNNPLYNYALGSHFYRFSLSLSLPPLLFIFAASVFLALFFKSLLPFGFAFFWPVAFQLHSSVAKRKAFRKNRKKKKEGNFWFLFIVRIKWITEQATVWLIDRLNWVHEYVLYETVKMKSAQGESLAHFDGTCA